MNIWNIISVKILSWSSFLVVLLLNIDLVTTTVYYSGFRNETFQNSSLHCQTMGGSLLTYGELLLKTAEQCGVSSTWTATPWYNKKMGCFFAGADKETSDGQEDKHLALCADFCADARFHSIGLWTEKCQCYLKETVLVPVACSSTSCPGNPAERCGLNVSGVLYEKAQQQSTTICRYRIFKDRSDAGVTEHLAFCEDKRPFICKVGTTDNIQCSLESEPKADGMSSATTGAIVGVVLGLAVVAVIIVLVLLFIKHRKKSSET